MKTIIKIILIGFYLVEVSFINKDGKSNSSENVKEEICMVAYGKIQNPDIMPKKVDFKLYEGNDLVVQGCLNRKNEFEISLYSNQNYILEIITPGYLPKRFLFNTAIPPGIDKLFSFGFEVELLKEELVKGADVFPLDFPFALISYNSENSEFSFSEKYSEGMKKEEKNAISHSRDLKKE